jgi:hypothetical protein
VTAAWVIAAVSTAFHAHATEVVDQENLPGATLVYSNCGTGPGSISQGFTPTMSPLIAVEIMMPPSPPAGTLTVRIRQGGVDGPIVGETTAPNEAGWNRYDFAGGVVVVPEQLYVIEVVDLFHPAAIVLNNADTYAGGNAYGCTDNPVLIRDVVFRTYAATTLPTREATWGKVKALYRE